MISRLSRKLRFHLNRLFARKRVLHCVGDSHVQYFEHLAKEYFFVNTRFRFCVVPGASNMGLANPHSKTQAFPIFRDYLNEIDDGEFLLLCLGEVDCGFVIWYRAEKHGSQVDEQFQRSLSNYFKLIELCLEKVGRKRLMVLSVPLPMISDSRHAIGEVANQRLGIKATQKERTDLTRKYNRGLDRFCKSMGVEFLNMEPEMLDKSTGLIFPYFKNQDSSDHHCDQNAVAGLLIPKLKNLGFR